MKRLTLGIICLFAVILSAAAKDINESQVPDQVKAYVSKHYPQATDKEWEYKDKKNSVYYYEVEFEVNGRDVELKIDKQGNLISSEEELATSDMPAFAKDYINSNYSDVTILGLKIKVEEGKVAYDVGISFKNKAGYARHRNIYFDENGKVLKK